MQRASAASPTTSIPRSASAQTPATEPAAKRRRVEDSTSSTSISVPGTPTNGTISGLATPTAGRGGITTFTRTGADTEWVLDLKVPSTRDKTSRTAEKSSTKVESNGVNGSASRFSALVDRNNEVEENSVEEEDIWNTAQSSGRQTFGSFKKQKSRKSAQKYEAPDGDEQDLRSASGSDDDSDSDGGANEGPALDSDEEMRRAKKAMEEKHRSMQGQGGGFERRPRHAAFSNRGQAGGGRSFGNAQAGQKRKGREEGSYKQKKKAKNSRKTI